MKNLPKSFARPTAQRGYSLIELSIALAIVGVVIAGSIIGVQSILRSNNVNKTIAQSNTAVNKVVAKLVRDSSYENATIQKLTRTGMEVWGATDIANGGLETATVTHPLSGRVLVAPLSSEQFGTIANQGLIYTLTGVPVAACGDLAVGLEGLALAMTVKNGVTLSAAPTTLTEADVVKKPPTMAFDSSLANDKCAAGGASAAASTTISFLVQRR